MAAVVLTSPGKSEVQQRPPQRCRPGEALITVAAVGVCATDVELFTGTMGYFESGLATWPMTPGHEWVGEIVALGRNCPSHLSVGQRVIGEHATGCQRAEPAEEVLHLSAAFMQAKCSHCVLPGGLLGCPRRAETGFFRRDGAFQTQMRFPAKQLHVIPDSVPWELAALAEPLATAHKGVRLAKLEELMLCGTESDGEGPRVLVAGDGPVGLLVLQVLRWRGARVVCLVGATASRLDRALQLGAESVWNITEHGEEELCKSLEESGGLVDVAIEAAGHPSAVPLVVRTAKPGGRVVLLGLSGNLPCQLRQDDIVLKQLTIRGSLSSEAEDWQAVADMLSHGAVQSVVTHALEGLEKYEEAIKLVQKPPAGMLKLLLSPNPERFTLKTASEDLEAELQAKRAKHAP